MTSSLSSSSRINKHQSEHHPEQKTIAKDKENPKVKNSGSSNISSLSPTVHSESAELQKSLTKLFLQKEKPKPKPKPKPINHFSSSSSSPSTSVSPSTLPLPPLVPIDWTPIITFSTDNNFLSPPSVCVICLQKFALRPSTLFICSHAFHTVCIQNVRKYSTFNTHNPSFHCPLCRREINDLLSYDITYQTSQCHYEYSAQIIQKWFRKHRLYPQLSSISSSLSSSSLLHSSINIHRFVSQSTRQNDIFVREIDQNLSEYKEQMKQLEFLLHSRMREQEGGRSTESIQNVKSGSEDGHRGETMRSDGQKENWMQIYLKNKERLWSHLSDKNNAAHCTFCCEKIFSQIPSSASLSSLSLSVSLTSCGHYYHSNCLKGYEEFITKQWEISTVSSSSPSHHTIVPKCAVCREMYTKVEMKIKGKKKSNETVKQEGDETLITNLPLSQKFSAANGKGKRVQIGRLPADDQNHRNTAIWFGEQDVEMTFQ